MHTYLLLTKISGTNSAWHILLSMCLWWPLQWKNRVSMSERRVCLVNNSKLVPAILPTVLMKKHTLEHDLYIPQLNMTFTSWQQLYADCVTCCWNSRQQQLSECLMVLVELLWGKECCVGQQWNTLPWFHCYWFVVFRKGDVYTYLPTPWQAFVSAGRFGRGGGGVHPKLVHSLVCSHRPRET